MGVITAHCNIALTTEVQNACMTLKFLQFSIKSVENLMAIVLWALFQDKMANQLPHSSHNN